MTGCAFLAVPGFLRVPKGVQEPTGATLVVRRFQTEEWSQTRTIVPDSYVPDQERSSQERGNAKVSADLPFLVPGIPERSAGTPLISYFKALSPVPGFLPSLKRGGGLGTAPLPR